MNRILLPTTFTPPDGLPAGAQQYTFGGETMGTGWQVDVLLSRQHSPAAIETAIQQALQTVIDQMSTWQPDSALSRWNQSSAGNWQSLPEDFYFVLKHALELAEASRGAYDPAVGPLVNLWGFGPTGKRTTPPSPQEINQLMQKPGWQEVRLDDAKRAALQPGDVYIDLSSIAKGYAVDLVAATLEQAGVVSYLVEIGGELKGLGTKTNQEPWWVALEQPSTGQMTDDAGSWSPVIAGLHEMAIATSGDYQKFFDHAARRYSHTIDPRTGWPVNHSVIAVSVAHPSCMLADGYATALMVMGLEEGMPFAEAHDLAARFIAHDSNGYREHMTTAFHAMLE